VSDAGAGRPATVDGVLRDAAPQLEMAVGGGRREARSLWAALEGVTPGAVWLSGDAIAPADLAARFLDAVRRRAGGEPFAYAAGRMTFRTTDLLIDRRALIPRPETEGLVDLVLRWSERMGPGGVAADLGTGSGCIALSLAAEGTFERVMAVERSASAATLARANVARLRPGGGRPWKCAKGTGSTPFRASGFG
jgi:release factor glutamine methyltransferase